MVGEIRIGDWLKSDARYLSNELALLTDEAAVTFRELNTDVNRLASALRSRGVGKGDRIALFATDSIEYVVALMASVKLGAVYVPLNYRLTEPELRNVLAASEPRVLFSESRYADLVSAVRAELTGLDVFAWFDGARVDDSGRVAGISYSELLSEGDNEEIEEVVTDDDLVGIAFTSGTTATPKGVLHPQKLVKHFVRQTYMEAEIPSGAVSYSPAPLHHNGGWLYVLGGIARGYASLISPGFEAERVLRWLQSGRINHCFLVPTMISALLETPNVSADDYPALETIAYGAAPIAPALLRRAIDTFQCDFINMFGAGTEAGLQTILRPEHHRRAMAGEPQLLASVGKPATGVDLRLVDADFNDVVLGEVGEIVTRSDAVMNGYLHESAETAGKVVDGWYKGGDMAWQDAEGFVYLTGRATDMIVRGGENIYPIEIESVLAEVPELFEVAVIGVPDDHWGEIVRAHVVMIEGAQFDAEAVKHFCRARLAAHKVPTEFRVEVTLPKNAAGKVLKRELRLIP
jgi:acyl-CoA synthetase (AMP-forming)/AMP-acid ligase II